MDKLTTKQKAQRYDEIIERVDELLHTSDKDSLQRKIESILIALKKNKDERIKDAAIEFIRQNNFFNYRLGISKEEVVAWIEKQCEHAKFINEIQVGDRVTRNRDGVLVNLSQLSRVAKKPIDQDTLIQQRVDALTQLKKQAEQKLVDKIELKFHKGDWIIHQGTENIYQVVAVIDNQYQLKYGDNYTTQYCIDVDRCARLYDVTKDAKDGDVLVNQNGEMPFIFKECKNNHIYCYCGYTNRKDIFFDGFVDNEGEELHWLNLYHEQAYPATKEQRNLLFSKMHEAGYEWNTEELKLETIEQKYDVSDNDSEKRFVQGDDRDKELSLSLQIQAYLNTASDELYASGKPLYSEKHIKDIHKCMLMWKKLHDSYFNRIYTWSEEDEKMFNDLYNKLAIHYSLDTSYKVIKWLKSIKERYEAK